MKYIAFVGLGATELLIILAIVILLFGGKKIPELAKSIGESVRGLKKDASSVKDIKDEFKSQANDARRELKRGLSDKEPPKRSS